MKKILLASTATSVVMFSGSVQAQTCTKTPDCATLGYTKTATDCSGLTYTRCPFDDSKYSCEGTLQTCARLGFTDTAMSCYNQYIPCPTDPTNTSAVKCLFTNKVGDLKYSRQTKNHDGWLKCDGNFFNEANYPELYSVLGRDKLPDYRGYFLKAGATYQSAMNTPEAAGLPNITGTFAISDNVASNGLFTIYDPSYITGPFSIGTRGSDAHVIVSSYSTVTGSIHDKINFDASKSNPIYGRSDTVTPPNYTANLFIFAGKGMDKCYGEMFQPNQCSVPNYGYKMECEIEDNGSLYCYSTDKEQNFWTAAIFHAPTVYSYEDKTILYKGSVSSDKSTVCYERPSCVIDFATYADVGMNSVSHEQHVNNLLAWCVIEEQCLSNAEVPSY